MNNNNISKYYADEHAVRITAAMIVILASVTLLTQWLLLAIFVTADFALRAFTPLPAPLSFAAKRIAKRAGLQPKLIFAAPKKFAAALGFVFAFSISVFIYLHAFGAVCGVGLLLIACAVLESAFSICLGCYVYDYVVAPLANKAYERDLKKKKLQ